MMQPIDAEAVSQQLSTFVEEEVFIHLETTRGAYTENTYGAFARNFKVRCVRAGIAGSGPYRVGIKTPDGWVYAEGLTHGEFDPDSRLLLAGHDSEGRLTVALQISREPFPMTLEQ